MRLGDVAGKADTAVGDQRHVRVLERCGDVGHRGDLRHADAGHDAGGTDRAGTDTDLDRIGARIDERARGFRRGDVAGDHLAVAPPGLDPLNRLDDALRVPVRGVDHHQVHARITQRGDAVERVGRRAHCRPDAQPPAVVLAGAREFLGLLEILHGDHADQLVRAAHHQQLLDAVLVQQREHLFLGSVLAHRDQALLRRHHRGDRGLELLLEAQVAVRDDADRLAADHHRNPGDAARAGEVQYLADRHVGRDRDRVADDAAFELLYPPDLARLRLDGHALVDDADATFLGDGDGEARLGHGVHGGRHQRHVEADAARDMGREVDLARQNLGVRRDEQDVVEGEGFFEDAHAQL